MSESNQWLQQVYTWLTLHAVGLLAYLGLVMFPIIVGAGIRDAQARDRKHFDDRMDRVEVSLERLATAVVAALSRERGGTP